MKTKTDSASPAQFGIWLAGFVFVAALTINLVQVTHNLDTGYLAGHEFRQSQTALSILFIQQDQNYDLAYPTPVFGPPWSIPMEFPLYQWSSAILSTETGASIPRTSRIISIVCFYLGLVAAGLLMRRFSADVTTILLALSLVLMAPIYIFYSRAVLIESMALALSLWFLWAFDIVRRQGSWWAVVATTLFGAMAAGVKVTTFAIWGTLALGLGLSRIVELTRNGATKKRNTFIAQASIGGIVPLVAGIAWVRFADAIKAESPGGFFLTSKNMSDFNFGNLGDRFDLALWQQLFGHAQTGVTPWMGWGLLIVMLGVPFSGRRSRIAIWLVLATVGTWLSFPRLYQIHDYYFYAVGMLPLVALAFSMKHLSHSTRWFWLPAALVVALAMLQWRSYATNYLPQQSVVSYGGGELLDFLNDATDPDDILLVTGGDWSANVPYFTQRRTMAFKQNLHDDPEIMERMMETLEPYSVAGLIVLEMGDGARGIIDEARKRFDIAANPTLRAGETFYYARDDLRENINFSLNARTSYVRPEIAR